MRSLSDRRSIEVFCGWGRAVYSATLFSTDGYLTAAASAALDVMYVGWPLKAVDRGLAG